MAPTCVSGTSAGSSAPAQEHDPVQNETLRGLHLHSGLSDECLSNKAAGLRRDMRYMWLPVRTHMLASWTKKTTHLCHLKAL